MTHAVFNHFHNEYSLVVHCKRFKSYKKKLKYLGEVLLHLHFPITNLKTIFFFFNIFKLIIVTISMVKTLNKYLALTKFLFISIEKSYLCTSMAINLRDFTSNLKKAQYKVLHFTKSKTK